MPGRLSLSEFAFVRPVMSDLRQRLHVHQWRPAVRLDEEAVSRRVETLISALPSRDRNIESAASWIDTVRDDG